MTSKTSQHGGFSSLRITLLVAAALTVLAGTLMWSLSSHALTSQEQHDLAQQASQWVHTEVAAQRPHSLPLTESEMEIFGPFFPPEVLEAVRVRGVDTMPAPKFLGKIRRRGKRVFDFRRARGLALGDTLLLKGSDISPGSPARRSVLFHELVHAVQYRALGVESFMELYLASLVANDYQYPDIAFEHQAFELQHRFSVRPDQPFSVEHEVQHMVKELQATLATETVRGK